jgi:quinoprotein dehydrogenase-associated probable ABC transporter substrate-binding protein
MSSAFHRFRFAAVAAALFAWACFASVAAADDLPCCTGEETFIPYQPAPGDAPDAPNAQRRLLRICADPNNLPFTNDRLEGFENKIAAIVAHDLKADVLYVWRAQRRGFFRQSLKEGNCDMVMGVPAHFERALSTDPYYTSTYCFVTRKNDKLPLKSMDDPLLRDLKIGVQIVGDDGVNTPPAHALAARGIVDNLVGFTLYGDYALPNPPARVLDAVARGDIDVAVVWGPLAGYFAKREPVELSVMPRLRPPSTAQATPSCFPSGSACATAIRNSVTN